MKLPDEEYAADALNDAVQMRSFNPVVFGSSIALQNSNNHSPIMAAVVGIVDALADKEGKAYVANADQAYRLARFIRESCISEYGSWPPPLDW